MFAKSLCFAVTIMVTSAASARAGQFWSKKVRRNVDSSTVWNGMDDENNRTVAVVALTEDTFEPFLQSRKFNFVDLDTPWCVWCRRLAPMWEVFAQHVQRDNSLSGRLGIGKIDCMEEANICAKQDVLAFPTLRWFEDGKSVTPDYTMDLSVGDLLAFVNQRMQLSEQLTEVPLGTKEAIYLEKVYKKDDDVVMEQRCQRERCTYGAPRNQKVSEKGGKEFDEFNDARQIKIAPACNYATSNARGKYNSFYKPCEFRFHQVTPGQVISGGSPLSLSNVCGRTPALNKDEVVFDYVVFDEVVFDYVREWPDECVGDFRRCYSVSKESEARIFLSHFCQSKWDIPAFVTHISVDCRDDKQQVQWHQSKVNSTSNTHDENAMSVIQRAKEHSEKIHLFVGLVGLTFCCCWAVLCLGYKLIAVPYLKEMKKSKSDPDLQSLTTAAASEDTGKATPGL